MSGNDWVGSQGDAPPDGHQMPRRERGQGELVEVLRAHWPLVGPVTGAWLCPCGVASTNGSIHTGDLTRKEDRESECVAHLAKALRAHVDAEVAAALEGAADDLEAVLVEAAEKEGRPHSSPAVPVWLRHRARIVRQQPPADQEGER